MSALGTYYYLTGVLFLIAAICDFIFKSQFSTCPFNNSAADLFFYIAIINIILVILLMEAGFLINYFDDMDPNELQELGFLKNMLTILVRLTPTIIKIVHYLKVLLVLICSFFAYFNNSISVDYLKDNQFMITYNATLHYDCRFNNSKIVVDSISSYRKNAIIFESIELFIVIFALCILGIFKNLIDIDGYFYEPEDPNQGGCRTLLFRRLGP